jgi:hypothetical protein
MILRFTKYLNNLTTSPWALPFSTTSLGTTLQKDEINEIEESEIAISQAPKAWDNKPNKPNKLKNKLHLNQCPLFSTGSDFQAVKNNGRKRWNAFPI